MPVSVIQPEDNDIFSFRFIFSTARRYWPWILACALLGAGLAYFICARQGYLYPQADDDDHRQCEQNPVPELRYFHGVCKCGYHGPVI